MSTTDLRGRVYATPATAGLAVGDVAALGLFVAVGQLNHGTSPLALPGEFLRTLAPFAAAWLLVAFAAELYGPAARSGWRARLARTAAAWLVALPLAHGLRVLVEGGTALAFVVVSAVVGGLVLVGWRALAGVVLAPAPGA